MNAVHSVSSCLQHPFILQLSYHCLCFPSCPPVGFPVKTQCIFLFCPICTRYCAYVIIFHLMTQVVRRTRPEAPPHAVFSNLMLLPFPWAQISSSFLICKNLLPVPFLCCGAPHFTPLENNRQNYSFLYFNLCMCVDRKWEDKHLWAGC